MISALVYADHHGLEIAEVIQRIHVGQLEAVQNERSWFINAQSSNTTTIINIIREEFYPQLSTKILNCFSEVTFFAGFVIILLTITSENTDIFGYNSAIIWTLACLLQGTLLILLAQIVFYLSKIE
jgi:hypothetical protein